MSRREALLYPLDLRDHQEARKVRQDRLIQAGDYTGGSIHYVQY